MTEYERHCLELQRRASAEILAAEKVAGLDRRKGGRRYYWPEDMGMDEDGETVFIQRKPDGSSAHEHTDEIAPRGSNKYFLRDDAGRGWDIFWGGYRYEIGDEQIKTKDRLLDFVVHISEKNWELATASRLGAFIDAVCARNGWGRHSGM